MNALELTHGKPAVLFFFETDCPACRLTTPYLNRLAEALGEDADCIVGISQDPESATLAFVRQMSVSFPVWSDVDLAFSRSYNPQAVPAIYLVDRDGAVAKSHIGFDKSGLNEIASTMGALLRVEVPVIAPQHDGAPAAKPGCSSRHLVNGSNGHGPALEPLPLHTPRGVRASLVAVPDGVDPYDFCVAARFGDPLPVIPPTVERVAKMLDAIHMAPDETIGHVPPCYGPATVEKIAANAVMAGCVPEMMEVLIPLVRAACDERFNMHGVQATTHFAAPLVIVNGPVRGRMGFASGSNVFSNVARANSTLGRALQLILANLGGARPGEIDMSTLGNAGKFSCCIAENEEENPWEPLHVDMGFSAAESTVTLFATEPPRGVSEHNARKGTQILKAICHTLATVWSYRMCLASDALVVLCPEHVRTLVCDGFNKRRIRDYLFENTAIPVWEYEEDGEGTQYTAAYTQVVRDGEACYLKFRAPESIKIVVAGGTAGKFSAVMGSWASGPRGSQMVTYPVE